MARRGTTPFYPQTKDELVADLKTALGKIKEQASTFASAAVPSVQAEVADRIYLSSFTPLNDAVGLGRPPRRLPQAAPPQGRQAGPRPGPARRWRSAGQSSCHLWDAGEVLLTQAPTPAEVAGDRRR